MDLVKLELDLRDRCREEWQIHVSSLCHGLCVMVSGQIVFNGGC